MTDSDRRKDYGPTGCVNRSLTLLLSLAWMVAVWSMSRSPARRRA